MTKAVTMAKTTLATNSGFFMTFSFARSSSGVA
jgi:hypothetical protein